jgi:hypothetical protein
LFCQLANGSGGGELRPNGENTVIFTTARPQ